MTTVNATCVNSTGPCPSPGSPAGLAVGLTLLFLLLLIVAAVVIYKYSSKFSSLMQIRQRRSQDGKGDLTESRRADPHQYTSLTREQPTPQTPIYENLNTLASGCNRPAAKRQRQPTEPEEDVYLQCDSADDGIYSNDPAHGSVLTDFREEDVYVVPDAI